MIGVFDSGHGGLTVFLATFLAAGARADDQANGVVEKGIKALGEQFGRQRWQPHLQLRVRLLSLLGACGQDTNLVPRP